MKAGRLFLFACLLWLVSDSAQAQTRLKLANIIPGRENVQLVQNGDFQFQGAATATNTHPFPTGWTRVGDIYADAGTNMVQVNAGVVARALVNGGAPVGQYRRVISLAPNTDYKHETHLPTPPSLSSVPPVFCEGSGPAETQGPLHRRG